VEPEIAPESAALHDSGVVPEAMPGLAGRSTAAGGSSVPDHFPTDEGAASPASDSAAPDVSRTRSAPRDGAADAVGSGQEVARSTPTGEGGAALQGLYAEYLARLRQLIHEALRYPPAARRRGLTGVVTIELTVVPSGEINDVSVVQSSSHPLLDDAAVETVQELRAQRFPTHLPRRPLRVRLPVVFQLE
jgi:protein TonB